MIRRAIGMFGMVVAVGAQTSFLQGTITDEQGAVIPVAIVTATNQDTAAARRSVADDAGNYTFVQMPPGEYKIEVQKPGFATYSSKVRLQVSVPSTLNIHLGVSQNISIVNVTAEGIQVNTQDATIGNPFTQRQ